MSTLFATHSAVLTLCMLGNFACFFVICKSFFFFKLTFSKKSLGIPSECQTVWIQIRPNILLGLIWVQTVCKGYQQMTKVATSRERVKFTSSKIICTFRTCMVRCQLVQFFFFFFLIWVSLPFQEYFTYIEPIVHQTFTTL